MAMLSRVAERMYWFSRYLERVSSTARLVDIYQSLLFDLPSGVKLSWYNLIIINDLEAAYAKRYSTTTEQNVVRFLLGDTENSSSLVNSLNMVRENVRTTRDVVPEEAWEIICELSLFVQGNLQQGIARRTRHKFLEEVIKGCLQITGLLHSCMPDEESMDFFQIGSHLECADMTSRYLEAGLAAILELEDDENAVNSQQIIWGSVLRALNATQYYLRTTRTPVKGAEVMPYLLKDPYFPRSVTHCIRAMISACENLPRSANVVKTLKKIDAKLQEDNDFENPGPKLLEHLNQTQIALTGVHFAVSETWFPKD